MKTKEVEKFDARKYVGKTVKIEKADIINTKYGLCLKIESEELENNIRASSIFSFGTEEDENGILNHFIVKDGKLDKFLKARNLDGSVIDDNIFEGMVV